MRWSGLAQEGGAISCHVRKSRRKHGEGLCKVEFQLGQILYVLVSTVVRVYCKYSNIMDYMNG